MKLLIKSLQDDNKKLLEENINLKSKIKSFEENNSNLILIKHNDAKEWQKKKRIISWVGY